jgi:hypothetical protein
MFFWRPKRRRKLDRKKGGWGGWGGGGGVFVFPNTNKMSFFQQKKEFTIFCF